MSCREDHRCSSGPALLWVWRRMAAASLIRSPSPGTSICCRFSPKKTKKERKKEREEGRQVGRLRTLVTCPMSHICIKARVGSMLSEPHLSPHPICPPSPPLFRTGVCLTWTKVHLPLIILELIVNNYDHRCDLNVKLLPVLAIEIRVMN